MQQHEAQIYIWHVLKGLVKDESANKFVLLKVKFYLWWLWLVVKKLLHLMSNSMFLLLISFLNLFKPRSFPILIFLDNVPFHKSCEVQEAFEEVGHICFHLLSYNPFLNVAEGVFAHVKNQVLWNDLQDHGTLLSHISYGA